MLGVRATTQRAREARSDCGGLFGFDGDYTWSCFELRRTFALLRISRLGSLLLLLFAA